MGQTKEGKAEENRLYREKNKEALRIRQKEYRAKNREKILIRDKIYRDKNKKELYAKQKEYRSNNKEKIALRDRNYGIRNRAKIVEKQREWAGKNKDKIRGYYRKYMENPENRGRAYRDKRSHHGKLRRYRKKGASGNHSLEERQDLEEQYNHTCPMCGYKGKLTRDHIIPIIKGGSNNIYNIQPLCHSCNSKKHTKIQIGYIALELFGLIKINPLTLVSLCV